MVKHKQMFCKECNEPIDFSYVTPERWFSITEDGKIERSDNNMSDRPEIIFYCSNDKEHDIGDSKDLIIWMDAVESDFNESSLYDQTRN